MPKASAQRKEGTREEPPSKKVPFAGMKHLCLASLEEVAEHLKNNPGMDVPVNLYNR